MNDSKTKKMKESCANLWRKRIYTAALDVKATHARLGNKWNNLRLYRYEKIRNNWGVIAYDRVGEERYVYMCLSERERERERERR